MDYGLFLNIANTGNDSQTGHRCPVQIAYKLWQFSKSKSISEFNCYVMPDEPILANSSIYCGITEELLNNQSISAIPRLALNDAIAKMSRLIQNIGNKNIYIIGWNVLEDALEILETTTKRLNIDDFNSKNFKVIDLKKLADLSLPINELGRLGPDTTFFWLEKNVNGTSELDVFKQLADIRNMRWQDTFCVACINMNQLILAQLMKYLNLQNVDEVYSWLEAPHKIEVLTFGKHKGELISDVYVKDNDYLCWLYSCKDIMSKNKDLKFTLDSLFAI